MKTDRLLKLAAYFEKLAELSEDQKIDIRSKIFTVPVAPYSFSFKQVADAVFSMLSEHADGKDLQDSGASNGPVYRLMSLINANAIPSAADLVSLSEGVALKTKELFPVPSKQYNVASHLVPYAQLLVKTYLSGVPQKGKPAPDSVPEEKPSTPVTPVAQETPYQFISRVYRKIRMGQSVDDDKDKWPSFQSSVVRRLNGLKGMATRTPAQESERTVLQALVDKLG